MEFLTIREAAARCGISYSALRKRVDRGTLESSKLDGVRKLSRATLERAGLWPADAPADGEPLAAPVVAEPEQAPEPTVDAAPLEREAIARRAFELYEAEGGEELDNWLKAERELAGSH